MVASGPPVTEPSHAVFLGDVSQEAQAAAVSMRLYDVHVRGSGRAHATGHEVVRV